MIDIKLMRENPEAVRETMRKKFQEGKLHLVDKALMLDEEWRGLKGTGDRLRAERNKVSMAINEAKKAGKDASKLMEQAKDIPRQLAALEERDRQLQAEIREIMGKIPNFLHPSVPIGRDDSENVDKKHIGEPAKIDFEPKNHVELAESLGIVDFESSRKTSGAGFYYLQGKLALLNQALLRFAIDKMVSKGFTYVETPLMLNRDVITNVADLNDMNNQIYKVQNEELYLIGTSEHSLIGRYIGGCVEEKDLPVKHTSYSMCFRKEIGSHGIEEKGLYRTHQFNKIEMIILCKPSESMKLFETLKEITIEIFSDLEIPVRVLEICSGDLGDLKHCQVDIEAWSPTRKTYYEVGSCSNLTDAQARRLGIKYVNKQGERSFVHTLNNTAIATSRGLVAVLENHQQKDGSIKVPKALWPYTGFKEIKKGAN